VWRRNLDFPLLADFEPKGKVSKAYGVYNDQEGQSERALFVLDEDGVIQWSYLSDRGVNPGADGIMSALEKMEKEKTI
jgi:peroxiredoxin